MLRVERHPLGPRVHVAGQRVHHGAAGILAAALLLAPRRVRLVGAAGVLLAIHDRHDWRYWFAPGDRQRDLEFLK